MTCSQNWDFVRMEAGSKDESAWCGMMVVCVCDNLIIKLRKPMAQVQLGRHV